MDIFDGGDADHHALLIGSQTKIAGRSWEGGKKATHVPLQNW